MRIPVISSLLLSALSAPVAVAILELNASAADWPQWRGPQRDGISRETGLLKSWPAEGPKVLWKADLGQGFSSFAVADGRVFTQYQDKDGQWLIALDEKTGATLWKIQTGGKA